MITTTSLYDRIAVEGVTKKHETQDGYYFKRMPAGRQSNASKEIKFDVARTSWQAAYYIALLYMQYNTL